MCAAVCVAVCAAVCVVGCVADCPQSLCASGLRCVVGCAVGCVACAAAGDSARRGRPGASVCGGGWRACAAAVGLPRWRARAGLRGWCVCGPGWGEGWRRRAAGDGCRFGPGCRHLRPRRQGVAACLVLPLRAVGSGRVPSSCRVQPLGARVRPRQAATPRRRNAQEPAAGPEPAATPSNRAAVSLRPGRICLVVLTGVKKK